MPRAPLAPGSRITLTRDSLLWSRAVTLSDLLSEIPGVYVARGGFVGQPEYVQYGGRGGSALELYWDGLPYEPMGSDTLFVDPGQIALSYLERIDIAAMRRAIEDLMKTFPERYSTGRENLRRVLEIEGRLRAIRA
ncbi:MAG: TonB-dependent receptor plug domain-containing protein, partial [Gemmatimonadales bacterium]